MLRTHRMLSAILLVPAILSACAKASPMDPVDNNNEIAPPPALDLKLTTDDAADRIQLTTNLPRADVQLLEVCLQVSTASGWWKGVGINQVNPTVQGQASEGLQCASVQPGKLSFTFWKAKAFGVHTSVGSRTVDLSAYAGSRVTLDWKVE